MVGLGGLTVLVPTARRRQSANSSRQGCYALVEDVALAHVLGTRLHPTALMQLVVAEQNAAANRWAHCSLGLVSLADLPRRGSQGKKDEATQVPRKTVGFRGC